jgi:hypothetical protein
VDIYSSITESRDNFARNIYGSGPFYCQNGTTNSNDVRIMERLLEVISKRHEILVDLHQLHFNGFKSLSQFWKSLCVLDPIYSVQLIAILVGLHVMGSFSLHNVNAFFMLRYS